MIKKLTSCTLVCHRFLTRLHRFNSVMLAKIVLLLIMILALNFTISATPKAKYNKCRVALAKCQTQLSVIACKVITDTVYIKQCEYQPMNRHERIALVKSQKSNNKASTKQTKSNNRKAKATDKVRNIIKGWSNTVFYLSLIVLFLSGASGAKLLQYLKQKIPFLAWLPI